MGFWIVWTFDALMTLVVLYFFMIGLSDGSVSSENGGLWFAILLILGAVLGGSLWLKATEHLTLAKTILWLLAVPGLIYCLFMMIVLIGKPRWN
jgi:hypothetical protein